MSRRTPRRPSVRRVALFVVSLLVSLCIAELALRGTVTAYDTENFTFDTGLNHGDCFRPSFSRGYEAVPDRCGANAVGATVLPEGGVGAAAKRVLLVGDSIATLGTWVERVRGDVERSLPGTRVEVHNYAVPGYNSCQEATVLAEVVDALDPHLILLQACSNDAIGSPVLLRVGPRARYFARGTVTEFPRWFLDSRILTLGMLTFGPRTTALGANLPERYVQECLSAVRDTAAERGIPLVSVLFPVLGDRAGTPSGPEREEDTMRAIHSSVGIPLVDLRPTLEAAGPMERFRREGYDEIHPNEAAQEIVAPVIAAALVPYLSAP